MVLVGDNKSWFAGVLLSVNEKSLFELNSEYLLLSFLIVLKSIYIKGFYFIELEGLLWEVLFYSDNILHINYIESIEVY